MKPGYRRHYFTQFARILALAGFYSLRMRPFATEQDEIRPLQTYNGEEVTTNMEAIQSDFNLSLPSCQETTGQSQPLATALSLDAAKNLCHQHFLKQCRTVQLRLPPEKRSTFPSSLLASISMQWVQAPGGHYEGQPTGCQNTPLVEMAGVKYQLHPAIKD